MSDQEVVRGEQTQSGTEMTRNVPVFQPAVDIYETESELVLFADLPGVHSDDLDIRLEDDILTIQGETKKEVDQGGSSLLHEFRPGRYYRQFALNEQVDREAIKANLKNGELKLVLPKPAKAQPRKIQVQTV